MPALLWSTSLLAGFAGSGHCVAMCGGIAAGLGAAAPNALPRAWWHVLFHTGRLAGYAIFGVLAGGLGAGVSAVLGLGPYLRIGTGIIIVLLGIKIMLRGKTGWLRAPERLGSLVWRALQPVASAYLPRHPIPRALLSGALWGWLPCGLVYSALVAAAVAGTAASGGATMVAFGLGTLPAMAGLGALASRLPSLGVQPPRSIGLLIIACGIWTAWLPASSLSTDGAHCEHRAPMAQARTS
ncbi:MAG: sulfite exporter TauE/SafE family protein [Proteobacteria bacterium]|nr:sulfite exporter TauE/SafE family protein [Pseudomonadota bacterium]